jgi:IS5 family transposase
VRHQEGLGIEDGIPDGTTLWLFRGTLAKAGLVENEAWEKNPAKNRQKDKDARWTKKHGKSFYGYKNHVNADARHKLIRQYDVTDASVHDSPKFDGLLNQANTSSEVYADSAYRSAETEAKLRLRGLRSRIHHRANRNHPLSWAQANANRKSQVRARIEHVFGAQQNSPRTGVFPASARRSGSPGGGRARHVERPHAVRANGAERYTAASHGRVYSTPDGQAPPRGPDRAESRIPTPYITAPGNRAIAM